MSGRYVVSTIAIAFALAGSPLAQEGSSQPNTTFRSAISVVTIQASVRDHRGRMVGGLTAKDFEVRDNGRLQPILSLRSDRQSPLSVAILIDMSGSMRLSSKTTMASQAYESVLSQLRQGQDEVAVFTFDSSLHEHRDFTRDVASLKGLVPGFDPFGTTSLYDAVAATARRLAARSATHKAVIVLTDGADNSSSMTARDVSGLASSIDVPVFVVATVPQVDQRLVVATPDRTRSPEDADLRDLAEWTGGQFVFASTTVETAVVASSMINDLRQQYVLAIEAASGREWRRLDLCVRRPSTIVKARSGYFAG